MFQIVSAPRAHGSTSPYWSESGAEFDFERWQADYSARIEAMHDKIRAALEAGKFVWEQFHDDAPARCWPLCSPFYKHISSPKYIAGHLIARHCGFGTIIVIDGVRHRLGKVVPETEPA